jgi:hypothetical protein
MVALKRHFLNKTDYYHKYKLNSLGWEVTISAMLESPQSPCRSILRRDNLPRKTSLKLTAQSYLASTLLYSMRSLGISLRPAKFRAVCFSSALTPRMCCFKRFGAFTIVIV